MRNRIQSIIRQNTSVRFQIGIIEVKVIDYNPNFAYDTINHSEKHKINTITKFPSRNVNLVDYKEKIL